MKKFKKIIAMGLAAMMALSIMCVGASAAMPDNGGIETMAVTPSTKVVLNSGQSSQIIPWPVANNYGYWKIQVDSRTTDYMTVRIHEGSPEGDVVFSGRVNPGAEIPFYCGANSPLSMGSYYVIVSTNGNANLGGDLYYKFATSYGELFN